MSRWYRAYEGTVTDPKLGEAALVAGASKAVAIASWHALLESAASAQDGGRFETSARRVAAALAEPLASVESVFAAFEEIGLIRGGVVIAWSRRQYESDTSAARTRQWRDRKKTSGDGDVTSPKQVVTAPETETETETEVALSTERAARPKRKQGLTCPSDFVPGETHYAWAAERKQPRSWVNGEADRMKRWSHENGHREVARKVDWSSALFSWMDKAFERLPGKTGTGPPSAQISPSSAWKARRLRSESQADEPSDVVPVQFSPGSERGHGPARSTLLEQDRGGTVRQIDDFGARRAFGR